MGVTMGLNPNGIPNPQMTPQPGMGIMAMMASTVPQPAALGGFPAVPGGDPTSAAVPVPLSSNLPLTTAGPQSTLLSPLNGDTGNGFESHHRRKSSLSPSVSLINVAKVSPQLSRPVTTPLLTSGGLASASEHQCWRTTVILLWDFPYYHSEILLWNVCVVLRLLCNCWSWRFLCMKHELLRESMKYIIIQRFTLYPKWINRMHFLGKLWQINEQKSTHLLYRKT